jgi:hypothetical protein
MFAWFAAVMVWTFMRKRATKKLEWIAEPQIAVDDETRKRLLSNIRWWKVWIALLVVLLPVGIAKGMAHRAWLPTLAGTAISLLLIYAAIIDIKRKQERLNLTR